MAEYTSIHTGREIDEALASALQVKQVRGLIKMTDEGPAAAVPGEDFPDGSGSTVSVEGLLKGVLNEETNEIEVQQANAGVDYQTPLTAGVDYATPTAVANKQNKFTTVTATLAVASWSSKKQTVNVSGVLTTNTIITAPAPASHTAWVAAGIYCSAQASGKLTFTCSTVPTAAITVNILIAG